MSFKMKYPIKTNYIPSGTKRRSGIKMVGGKPTFGVLHDTGNPGSTAAGNVNYYINSRNSMSASAHTFIDDKEIIECIPLTTGTPEKAWHVIYDVTTDNKMFGANSNDRAGGVELCFGGAINFEEAYKRYVWYNAYTAYKFGFNPTRFVGHHILDPKRKTDPENALKRYGKTYAQLLKDIVAEYNECAGKTTTTPTPSAPTPQKPTTQPTSYVGKRVEAKTSLRYYNRPSWEDKDVAGTVTKGLGFTIVDKVKVGTAYQYKVKNSKGAIYYITASDKYVAVI